jgi:LytS/YehU family sensor histidine kinase
VPNLILQPLVENAIRHGIAQNSGGNVEVRSSLADGKLLLQVLDDGAGLVSKCLNRPGLGLSNTRARLDAIYGKEHDFVLRNASNGGAEAAIRIPFQPLAQPAGNDGNSKNQDAHSG